MLLVIDAGNTNIVFAVHDGKQWRGIWRTRTAADRTSDEYAVWLLALLSHANLKTAEISAAVIGTVVPAALYHLRRCCREWFNVEPLVARSTLDWGFKIRVDRPPEVGADRLLNALASHRRFGGPLIVVDFGTATTFDVISAKGEYLGGVIVPGIEISLEALYSHASLLRRVELVEPRGVIGRSTVESIQSGVLYGYAELADGLCQRIQSELGTCTVVGTGGLAALMVPYSRAIEHHDPWLTLRGLGIIFERNVGTA